MATWDQIRNGIFAGESGGDYNALFGYSNRDGGKFAGTRLTDMTVDQALDFANPSGPYGQWVKGQVGRVATPMGAYQIVGTTLRGAKEGLGLTGNEKMTPELQERLGQHIYQKQGTGAWEGYKGPRDSLSGGGGSPSMAGGSGNDRMGTPDMQQEQEKVLGMNPNFWTALSGAVKNYANPGSGDDQMRAALNAKLLAQNKAVKNKNRNVTAQWLRSQGRDDYADAVEQGVIDGKTAFNAMMQQPDQGTSAMQYYQFLVSQGMDPQDAMGRAFSGGVTVNTGETQTEYEKARGKRLAERMQGIQTDATSALSALTSLDVMEQAMSDPGFYSGAGGDNALLLKRVGKTLGFDVDGIDSMETFNAQSKSAALDVMGGSLGTGFSNADRDFVLDQVPNLSNTPEGNRTLIEVQRRIQQRKIDISQMARQFEAENSTLLGFDQVLAQWAAQNPVFDPRFMQGLSAAPQAAPTVRIYNPETGGFND